MCAAWRRRKKNIFRCKCAPFCQLAGPQCHHPSPILAQVPMAKDTGCSKTIICHGAKDESLGVKAIPVEMPPKVVGFFTRNESYKNQMLLGYEVTQSVVDFSLPISFQRKDWERNLLRP